MDQINTRVRTDAAVTSVLERRESQPTSTQPVGQARSRRADRSTSASVTARRRAMWLTFGPPVFGTLGIIGFLVLWQVASTLGWVDSRHMPPPTVVLEQFFVNLGSSDFWLATGYTLRSWHLGVIISTAAGLVIGIIIGSSSLLVQLTHTTIEFLRPIPAVALIPIAALIFGPRLGSELLIIIYACFWIVLIQVLYGIADLDKVATDTARTMNLNFTQYARHVVFPTLLPFLMTGLRLVATVSLILAISVELIVGTPGLGQAVALAQINGATPTLYALIITSGLLGIGINTLMRVLERKTLFWHESVRNGATA